MVRMLEILFYIDDIVDLYKLLSKKLFENPKYSSEVFNAGTNKPHKIKDILKKIYMFKNMESEYNKIIYKAKNNKTSGEISIQFMDHKKLKIILGGNQKYR